MICYKHTPLKFAEKLLLGEGIKVGTFQHYRHGEGDRADPEEGLQMSVATGTYVGGSRMARRAERVGFKVSEGSKVTMRNNRVFYSVRNNHIFCSSSKPDFGFASAHNLAIVEFDTTRLATALVQGNPHLQRYLVRKVRYNKGVGNVFGHMPHPDPFIKHERFSWENEVRILFLGRPAADVEYLNAPKFSGSGRIVHRPIS